MRWGAEEQPALRTLRFSVVGSLQLLQMHAEVLLRKELQVLLPYEGMHIHTYILIYIYDINIEGDGIIRRHGSTHMRESEGEVESEQATKSERERERDLQWYGYSLLVP